MAGNRYPHEGITGGKPPKLGSKGTLTGQAMNDGLGHRVPAAASGSPTADGEVRPGGTQGENMIPAAGVAPEFARPGGAEEIK